MPSLMLVPPAVSEELKQTYRQTDKQIGIHTDRIALYTLDTYSYVIHRIMIDIFTGSSYPDDIFVIVSLAIKPTACGCMCFS